MLSRCPGCPMGCGVCAFLFGSGRVVRRVVVRHAQSLGTEVTQGGIHTEENTRHLRASIPVRLSPSHEYIENLPPAQYQRQINLLKSSSPRTCTSNPAVRGSCLVGIHFGHAASKSSVLRLDYRPAAALFGFTIPLVSLLLVPRQHLLGRDVCR